MSRHKRWGQLAALVAVGLLVGSCAGGAPVAQGSTLRAIEDPSRGVVCYHLATEARSLSCVKVKP